MLNIYAFRANCISAAGYTIHRRYSNKVGRLLVCLFMKDVPWKNNRKNHQDVQKISILNFLAFSNHRLQNKTHEKYNDMTARNAQFSESGWEMMASRWDQKMSSINKHISKSKNAFKSFNFFFWFLWITKKKIQKFAAGQMISLSDLIASLQCDVPNFLANCCAHYEILTSEIKHLHAWLCGSDPSETEKWSELSSLTKFQWRSYRVLNKVVKLVNSNFSCSPYLIWVCSNENLLSCLSQKFRSAANFYLHVYFIRSLCSPIHDLLKCDWGLYQIFSHENLLLTVWAAFHQRKQNCRFIMTLWRDLLTDWLETCLCITVQCAKLCNILFNYGACKLQLIC